MQCPGCSLGFHRLCPFGKVTALPGLCLQNGNYISAWSLHIHKWDWRVLMWNKGIWFSFCGGIAWPSKAAAADTFCARWVLPAPVGKWNHTEVRGCFKIVSSEKKEGSKDNLVDSQWALWYYIKAFLNFQVSRLHPLDLYINFVSSEHFSSISLWSFSIFIFLLM